jgi:hypothetical protein
MRGWWLIEHLTSNPNIVNYEVGVEYFNSTKKILKEKK